MTYVQQSGPKDRKIAWLRPTMEQDVDSSAVSAVVDVSSADGRQQRRSNGWQSTLELRPTEPSGIRSAALRYETRKSSECRAVQSEKLNYPALNAQGHASDSSAI